MHYVGLCLLHLRSRRFGQRIPDRVDQLSIRDPLIPHGHERTTLRGGRNGVEARRLRDIRTTFRAPSSTESDGRRWRIIPRSVTACGRKSSPCSRRARVRAVRYRNTALSAVETDVEIPTYRQTNLDVAPAEYTELRRQLATFDVVAPRLAVLFRVTNRTLHSESVGADPGTDRTTTPPFPDWLDAARGRDPSIVPFDEFDEHIVDRDTIHFSHLVCSYSRNSNTSGRSKWRRTHTLEFGHGRIACASELRVQSSNRDSRIRKTGEDRLPLR